MISPLRKSYGVNPAQYPVSPCAIVGVKLDAQGVRVWATSIGASTPTPPAGIAVDLAGNVFLTGEYMTANAQQLDFPKTRVIGPAGAISPCLIVAVKLDRNGKLLWSDWINGSSEDDVHAIAVDLLGNAYLAVETMSLDFPVTRVFGTPLGQAVDPCLIVAVKLDPSGQFVWGTAVNGSGDDEPTSMTVDLFGRVYLAGVTDSADFPFTDQTGQGKAATRMFALRLNFNGTMQQAVGIAGGSLGGVPTGIGLDALGRVYLGGYTSSGDFPVTQGAIRTQPFGKSDGFLLRLSNFSLQ